MEGIEWVTARTAAQGYSDRIEKDLGKLLMEPFCYRPWEIGLLTDSQVNWIFRSAARHAKAIEAMQKGEDEVLPTFADAEVSDSHKAEDFLRRFNIKIDKTTSTV